MMAGHKYKLGFLNVSVYSGPQAHFQACQELIIIFLISISVITGDHAQGDDF